MRHTRLFISVNNSPNDKKTSWILNQSSALLSFSPHPSIFTSFPPPILPLTCITSITSSLALLLLISLSPPFLHLPSFLSSLFYCPFSLCQSASCFLIKKKISDWNLRAAEQTQIWLFPQTERLKSAKFHWIIRKSLNCFLLCEQRDSPDVKRTILPDRWAQTLQWAARSAKTGPNPKSWTHQSLWCVTRKRICCEVVSGTFLLVKSLRIILVSDLTL